MHDAPSPKALNASMALFFNDVFAKAPHPADFAEEGGWIDVRDCARAHVLALEVPNAGGKRIILNSEAFIWQDWCMYFSLSMTP